MSSNRGSPLSDIGRPGRPFWALLGVVLALVLSFMLLIEGAILLAFVVAPFVFLLALGLWFVARLAERSDVPVRSEPVTAAGVLSVLVFFYSLLIEGAVLLGLVACVLLLASGGALGVVLAQEPVREQHSRSHTGADSRSRTDADPRSDTEVETATQDTLSTRADRSTARNADRETDRTS